MKVYRSKPYVDRLKGHKQPVLALYSPQGPQGNILYSCSEEGTIRIWDLTSKEITHRSTLTLTPHNQKSQPQYFKYYTDAQLRFSHIWFIENIVYGGLMYPFLGTIFSWNIKDNTLISVFEKHETSLSHLSKLNGRQLLSSSESTICLWDTVTGGLETTTEVPGTINKIAYLQNREQDNIYVLADRCHIYEIAVQEQKITQAIDLKALRLQEKLRTAYYVTLAAAASQIILETQDFEVEFYSLPLGGSMSLLKRLLLAHTWIRDMVVYDKNYLFMGCDDQGLRCLSLKDYAEIDRLEAHGSSINVMEMCSGRLYTGSQDCTIVCWDMKEVVNQHRERCCMLREDIESRKYQLFVKVSKKKKKGGLKSQGKSKSKGKLLK